MNPQGVALCDAGDLEGAASAFADALKAFPKHANARANLSAVRAVLDAK